MHKEQHNNSVHGGMNANMNANRNANAHGRPGMGGGPRGRMGLAEKPKDFRKSMGKLLTFLSGYKAAMILALVMAICSTVFTLIGPGKLEDITNLITAGMMTTIDTVAVYDIVKFLAVIYALSLIFGYAQGSIFATISQRICQKMRGQLTEKINRLPLSYFDTHPYGDTLSRMTNDIDTIGNSLNQSIASTLTGVVQLIGSLILMFATNAIMAVSGLLAASIGFVLMMVLIKRSQRYFAAQQRELGSLNGHIEESYTGHTLIKAYNAEEKSEETFDEGNKRLYNAAWRAQYVSGLMMPIMGFVGNFAYVTVCIVGAVLALGGYIQFGVIVAFMMYIRLFTHPLSSLAQAANVMQSAAAASERVFEILEETELSEELNKNDLHENIKGDITFQNVKFGYNPEKIIIKDFSAEIKAGQKVAIVGPTGAGKTTLVNLLMRFYEINSGDILIDGKSIANVTRENLHDKFAMVLQDTWMFEGTIAENIAYNLKDITRVDIVNACKAVGLHHTIRTMSHGYDTPLSGATLSAGERQLLTIARAMVKKADLLILDEATSSVDTRTEVLIQNAMDKLSKGKTSFIIAHRLSTIKNADVILVMKDGNIIETGNHEALIAKNGFYAELYNSQFDDISA